jgi:hypothetical protein
MNFLGEFSKNPPIQDFIEFPQVEAELIHADEEVGGHDDANSRFSQFCESARKRQ